MPKIENPTWAPENFGALLKSIRLNTCGRDMFASGFMPHMAVDLCLRMVKQIENGKRNITELETFYYLRAIRDAVGDKLDDEINSREDLPQELRHLAAETIPTTEEDLQLGYAMPPARLCLW